jgi:superfamily II DNA helicase RecQ
MPSASTDKSDALHLADRLEGKARACNQLLAATDRGAQVDWFAVTEKALEALDIASQLLAASSRMDARSDASQNVATPLPGPAPILLDSVGEQVFQTLRAWRLERARKDGLSPYVVAYDRSLRQMARDQPTTLEALEKVQGMGSAKAIKYGPDLLEVLQPYTIHQGGCSGDCERMPNGKLACATPISKL